MTVSRVPLSSLANGTVWALTGGLLTPAAGATAFVYEHGTTNEVTVYAGQTGETTLTQPLTTSTGGQLPGYVLGEQDLDIVATFEGKTPPAAEVVPLRAADIVGEDSHTKGPALGAGVVPLLSGQGGGAVSEAEVTTAVAAEATTRAAADTTLANAITAAITTAEAASDTAGTAAADVKVEKERAEAAEVLKIPLTQRGAANGVPTLDGEEHLTLSQVPPSVVTSSATGGPKSPSKAALRALEEYSVGTLVSKSTNCTSAIAAAFADAGAIDVPIQLLSKVYLTEGGTKHPIPPYLAIFGAGCYLDNQLGSIIKLEGATGAVNTLQSESWGSETKVDPGITLKDFGISNNMANQTERGVKAMPLTFLTAAFKAGEGTAHVVSTESYPASGLVWLGRWLIKYTGTTATTFTGCTEVLASTGELLQGAWVFPHNSQGHCLALQSEVGRFDNLYLHEAQASNLRIQGVPAVPAYENNFKALKANGSNRFAVENGVYASDNNFTDGCVLGDHNGMGQILDLTPDTKWGDTHLVGSYSPQTASVIIAASVARITNPNFDSIPYALVRFDSSILGGNGGGIKDPNVTEIGGEFWNFVGAKSTSAITVRRGGTESTVRGRISGAIGDAESPNYKWLVRNGSVGGLLGGQNPKTLSLSEGGSGLLQLDTVADFPEYPLAAEAVTVGTNTLTRTGKSTAISQTEGETAKEATIIKLSTEVFNGSAAFAASGILLVAGGKKNATPLEVTYGKYNAAEHKFEECAGITSAIPSGAQVTQCFLTGCTGGTKSETVAAGQLATLTQGTMFKGMHFDLDGMIYPMYSLTGSDIASVVPDWQVSEKGSYYQAVLTIAESGTEVTAEHKLCSTPTILLAAPQGELAEKVHFQVTATSGNVKIKILGGTAPAGGYAFTVTARVTATIDNTPAIG